MATITTDTFLDDGTARTAGEVWTCNGGRLTIRTDSRWHVGSPASMTGSLGSLTISATLGGGYTIDGTAVRWMPFGSGTGNVPAIGTTITGVTSGANGYLLGVYASITAAPTAVGAAMPASGFIKLREADAAYNASEALTGIGASTTGVDVVGWIEVVHDQAAAITVPRLGSFVVRGAWFSLGTTSGAANQVVQLPRNGSATAYVPGLWIANVASPVTDDDYDFYPAIFAAGMITANLGTDARSKFVLMGTAGECRIGHNGTVAVGFVPPAGREIRVPNVFGRQCNTASRATNALPNATAATRPDFTTTNAGVIDVEHFLTDWYLNFLQPYALKLRHVGTFDYVLVAECATAVDLYDGGNGFSQSIDQRTLSFTSCFAGGTVEKWAAHRYSSGTTDHAVELISSIGIDFVKVISGIVTFSRSTGKAFQVTQSTLITFTDCIGINQGLAFTTSFECRVDNYDHCDRYVGATDATTGQYVFTVLASCINIVMDGVTFGLGGTIANVHPYLGILTVGQSEAIYLRNGGTRATPLSGGSANNPAYIYLSSGNNNGVKVQRVYLVPTRTGAISTINSDTGAIYEHVYGDMGDTMVVADLNAHVKNCGGTNTVTGQASVYGTHFTDAFTSDTVGRVILALNEPTALSAPYVSIVSLAVGSGFTSAGSLAMKTAGDEVIVEQDYFVLGCTALANSAPVVTGTNVTYSSGPTWGNHNIYYQIDVNDGSGWNGTWKDLTAANLSSETIDPALGFKLKYRMVCATTATTNVLTYIRILTDSTLVAQQNNLYPLDTVGVTFTGLVAGAEIRVFRSSDGVEVAGTESTVGTTFTASFEPDTYYVSVIAVGYLYVRRVGLVFTESQSYPINLSPDANFRNP